MKADDVERSPHPAVSGREPQLADLADQVRRLVELTVTNTAPPDVLAALSADIRGAADVLEGHVPDPPPPRYVSPTAGTPAAPDGVIGRWTPYDPVVGRYNPLALPLVVESESGVVLAKARFGTAYEGAPGCVHGAVIAACFDLVLTAANRVAGAYGPTVRLEITYRKPTLLDVESHFEGEVVHREGRRVRSRGRVVQDGLVTVEADGTFAVLDVARIAAMRHRRGAPG